MKFSALGFLLEAADSGRLQAAAKRYPAAMDHLESISRADPSANKSYVMWLAKLTQQTDEPLHWPEDEQKVREALQRFEDLKRQRLLQGPDADIMRYKTFGKLHAAVSQQAERHASSDMLDRAKELGGVELVLRHRPYEFWRVSTPDAIMVLAQDTGWCVKDQRHAQQYANRGPFVLVLKDGKRIGLMHEATGSFKDVHDVMFSDPLDLQAIAELAPQLGIKRYSGDLVSIMPLGDMDQQESEIIRQGRSHAAIAYLLRRPESMGNLPLVRLAMNDASQEKALNMVISAAYHGMPVSKMPGALRAKAFGRSQTTTREDAVLQFAQKTGQRLKQYEKDMHDPLSVRYYETLRHQGRVPAADLEDVRRSLQFGIREVQSYVKRYPGRQNDPWVREELFKTPVGRAWYASHIHRERLPEVEGHVADDPKAALHYARHVIHGRWPEGERAIAQNIGTSVEYATLLDGKPFEAGEDVISTNPAQAVWYAQLTGRRMPKAEPDILRNMDLALPYATYVLRRRWPEMEEALFKGRRVHYPSDKELEYWEVVAKRDGLQAVMDAIGQDGPIAQYVRQTLERRGVAGEQRRQTRTYGKGPYTFEWLTTASHAAELLGAENSRRITMYRPVNNYHAVLKDGKAVGLLLKDNPIPMQPDGKPMDMELAADVLVHAIAAGVKSLKSSSRIMNQRETDVIRQMTADGVLLANSPDLAFTYIQQTASKGLPPTPVLELATREFADKLHPNRAQVMALEHLVSSLGRAGLSMDKLPGSWTKPLRHVLEDKNWQINNWAKQYGRFPQLEPFLGSQQVMPYLNSLQDADRQQALEAIIKAKRPTAERLALHAVLRSALKIEPPDALKTEAAKSPETVWLWAKYFNSPLEAGEGQLAKSPEKALWYGSHLKRRLPKAVEQAVAKMPVAWDHGDKTKPSAMAITDYMRALDTEERKEFLAAMDPDDAQEVDRLYQRRYSS